MGNAPPLIEIGWIYAGVLDRLELAATERARLALLTRLRSLLPEFEWRMPLVHRRRLVQTPIVQPALLLDAAANERQARRWDFAIVVTGAELVSYYTPWSMGMPARALSAAVISTAHIEPSLVGGDAPDDAESRLALRLERLAMHLLGHLNRLHHTEEGSSVMAQMTTARDLERAEGFLPAELQTLRGALQEVADLRLEERPGPKAPVAFYLKVLRHSFNDIRQNVLQLAPWRFPLRFSRMTIAAFSTLFLLLITAESWDLGTAQPPLGVLVMALAAIGASSLYILKRQRLWSGRGRRRLTELGAVTNVSMLLSVLLGVAATFALLFVFAFAFSQLVFPSDLAASWAGEEAPLPLKTYLTFSGFVATMGMLIGALGASFESEGYFRHVAYVDEET